MTEANRAALNVPSIDVDVAIIGAGPAGLTAGYLLTKVGPFVHEYESLAIGVLDALRESSEAAPLIKGDQLVGVQVGLEAAQLHILARDLAGVRLVLGRRTCARVAVAAEHVTAVLVEAARVLVALRALGDAMAEAAGARAGPGGGGIPGWAVGRLHGAAPPGQPTDRPARTFVFQ